jgi:hypothetical protein
MKKLLPALPTKKASSDDIEVPSRLVETELAWAQRKVEQEKTLALNPNLDAEEALHACKLAELHAERLRHSLQLLQRKHRQALSEEYRTRWLDRQQTARQRRDAASERFSRLEGLINELVATFVEAMQADQLVNEANGDAPSSENERLLRTEEHARGLPDGFTRSNPSLMKTTMLLDFNTGDQIWPPRSSVGAAYAAMTTPADHRRYAGDASSEWWMRGKQVDEARARREQEQLVQRDDFYNGRTR